MRALLVAAAGLALAIPPSDPSLRQLCVNGTSVGCDDHDPCTADRCENLACIHAPLSGPACNDHDACTRGDRCQAGRCVGVPITCDDAFSCTDDACVAGACTHVRVDSRCVPPDTCTSAVCAPERPSHDPAGCSPGPALPDGNECAEDGDACTSDVCETGRCMHTQVTDLGSCTAVQAAFQHALGLEGEARGVMAAVSGSGNLAGDLATVASALDGAARMLAGKTPEAATSPSDGSLETPLQHRARLALALLRQMRPHLVAAVRAAGLPQVRAQIGGDAGAGLRRRLRALARGTRALRGEVRRLVGRRGSFVR